MQLLGWGSNSLFLRTVLVPPKKKLVDTYSERNDLTGLLKPVLIV